MNNKHEQNANDNVPTGGFTDKQQKKIENTGNPLLGANNYDNLSSSIEPDEIADKDEYIDEP